MGIVPFWFSPEVQPFWFVKDDGFDETIRRRFGKLYQELVENFHDDWLDTLNSAEVALAYVIALDQFPRNMFRDSPKAFATDEMALRLSKKTIDKGLEKELLSSSAYLNFLYMPFMHSENLKDQEEGVRLFSSITENDQTVAYAKQHRDIIAQFGRFPHRNKILGRSSTLEEIKFLKEFSGF